MSEKACTKLLQIGIPGETGACAVGLDEMQFDRLMMLEPVRDVISPEAYENVIMYMRKLGSKAKKVQVSLACIGHLVNPDGSRTDAIFGVRGDLKLDEGDYKPRLVLG